MTSKRKCQEKHAQFRAKQRYDIDLPKEEIEKIVVKIQSSGGKSTEAECLCKQSRRTSIWKVFHNEIWINVVYDSKRHVLSTVLPSELDPNYIESKDINNFIVNGADKPKIHKNDITLGGFIPEHWLK